MLSVVIKALKNVSKIIVKPFKAVVASVTTKNKLLNKITEKIKKLIFKILCNQNSTVISTYNQKIELYERNSSYYLERMIIEDILLAYDLLVTQQNLNKIDLIYIDSKMGGGYYASKSKISRREEKFHFSTRVASNLNKLKIKLHDFPTSIKLRLYLLSINLTKVL